MEREYLISVIMPVYNVERYLREAIDSIVRQTYKNLELVLVDDGSTDMSGKICDFYEESDERVKVIHQANGGLSAARNIGIRHSKGEYLLFVDGDDYIADNTLQNLIETAKGKKADCVLFETDQFDDLTQKVKPYSQYSPEIFRINQSAVETLKELLQTEEYQAMACGYMLRRSVLEKTELSFEKGVLHEDELFTLQYMLNCNTLALVDHPCYYYRMRENSIMHNKKNAAQKGKSLLFIIERLIQLYEKYTDDMIRSECLDIRLKHLYMRATALYFDGGVKVQREMNSEMRKCMKQVLNLDREWSKEQEIQATCRNYLLIGLKTDIKSRKCK